MFDEKAVLQIVENGPEIMAYFLISEAGRLIFYGNHDIADGRVEDEAAIQAMDRDMEKGRQQQLQIIRSLPKYGVETPLGENDAPTEEYWKWFKWWKAYVEGLPEETWRRLDRALTNNEDVSAFRPEESWK